MKESTIYIVLCIFFYSCSNKLSTDEKVISIRIDNIEKIKNNEIIKNVEVIPLETNEHCFLGKVEKIICTEDNFYVNDRLQNTIFTFSRQGEFINKLQKVGKGANEYRQVSDFVVNKKTKDIEVIDYRNLITYNSNNECKKRIRIVNKDVLSINQAIKLDEDNYAFYSAHKKEVLIYSKEMRKFCQSSSFNYPEYTKKIPTTRYKFFSSENIHLYCAGYPYDAYQVSSNGVELKYRFDFGSSNLQIDESRTNESDYFKNLWSPHKNNKKVKCLMNIFETNEYIISTIVYGAKPLLLLYNKLNSSFRLINNDLPRILTSSGVVFYGNGTFVICFTPEILISKAKEYDFFSKEQLALVNKLKIVDNPILVTFDINCQVSPRCL